MQPLQQIYIGGSNMGLRTDVKPFMLPEQAFSTLENAYVWRERVKKREGNEFFGRLRRKLVAEPGAPINLVNPSPNIFNIFTLLGLLATEPNAQIDPGTALNPISIVIGAQTLTDSSGNGVMTIAPAGNITAATINYANGNLTISFAAPAGPLAVTLTLNYFPELPVMGIWMREIPAINEEQTIFFDTTYAYVNNSGADNDFEELISATPTTWSGNDSDFFLATNYRGVDAFQRLFFVTNFNNGNNAPPTYDPIRYFNGATWTNFAPFLSQSTPPNPATDTKLYQARILIPYYGRLLALNTWEGTTAGGAAGAQNYFNRCRFSQIGNPLDTDPAQPLPAVSLAWRADLFGRGGFIDAPTNEAIVSAIFFKNTLIVGFEKSTWQLRYVGEYGLPFIWERISSDFGCESTFSSILFDEGVVQVGDRAIVAVTSNNAKRIDEQIPDTVFSFRNDQFGKSRVIGVRNFQKEISYWCYTDTDLENSNITWKFPNKTLVYNYRNNTYAKFRNNNTFFGTYQSPVGVTWDRTDIYWDDMTVLWDNDLTNPEFPSIVCGNQQGYIHFFANTSIDEPSLSITGINFAFTAARITVKDHNLANGEWIKITGALFYPADPVASAINNQIFQISVVDANTLKLYYWNGTNSVAYSNSSLSAYIGSGQVTLLPKLNIQTKDFNPYQSQGSQLKISYIDFLTDATPNAQVSVNLLINSTPNIGANIRVGNTKFETNLPAPYYIPSSDYSWHRFFATSTGQYIRIQLTYDNSLMSTITTHQQDFTLNAIALYVRPGSRNVF